MAHILTTRLEAIRKRLYTGYEGNIGLPSAQIGSEREFFCDEFLKGILSRDCRVTSGCVIDSIGHQTGQLDIVVEHRGLPSFPLGNSHSRLMMAESVACVIEVKSNLAKEWKNILSKCAEVRSLRRKWAFRSWIENDWINAARGGESEVPFIAVGYTGWNQAETLKSKILEARPNERPDAVLIIEPGIFYSTPFQGTGPYSLFALAAVLNDYITEIVASRIDYQAYGNNG